MRRSELSWKPQWLKAEDDQGSAVGCDYDDRRLAASIEGETRDPPRGAVSGIWFRRKNRPTMAVSGRSGINSKRVKAAVPGAGDPPSIFRYEADFYRKSAGRLSADTLKCTPNSQSWSGVSPGMPT
jgi:hypothetical protein